MVRTASARQPPPVLTADWPRLGGGSGKWADASDDEEWDADHEALAQMEAREDRERGADADNADTLGAVLLFGRSRNTSACRRSRGRLPPFSQSLQVRLLCNLLRRPSLQRRWTLPGRRWRKR